MTKTYKEANFLELSRRSSKMLSSSSMSSMVRFSLLSSLVMFSSDWAPIHSLKGGMRVQGKAEKGYPIIGEGLGKINR